MKQPKTKRAKPGKPRLSDTEETVTIRARVTKSQAETFLKIGGSKWLRSQIDGAKKSD